VRGEADRAAARRGGRRDRSLVAIAESAVVGRLVFARTPRRALGRVVARSGAGMKILWVKTDFLHPTTRGGQIRTLEMVRQIHRRHEIHYVAFDDPANPEGLRRSPEYSTQAYPVSYRIVPKRSIRFVGQLATGLFFPIPVAGM